MSDDKITMRVPLLSTPELLDLADALNPLEEQTPKVLAALTRLLTTEIRVLLDIDSLTKYVDKTNKGRYTDGTPAPATCTCGEIPTHLMAQTGKYLLNGTVHRLGEPCYHSDLS